MPAVYIVKHLKVKQIFTNFSVALYFETCSSLGKKTQLV